MVTLAMALWTALGAMRATFALRTAELLLAALSEVCRCGQIIVCFETRRFFTTTLATEVFVALAGRTVPVLGCDLEGEDVHTLQKVTAAIVVIGSEGRGLSDAVKQRVSRRVTIPRFGRAESLNAGVAAAIVCDNLRRISGSTR